MKVFYSAFLPAIPTSVPAVTCDNCGHQFIIMNRLVGEWSYLAAPDFCPRCGYGHKTDYAGAKVEEE